MAFTKNVELFCCLDVRGLTTTREREGEGRLLMTTQTLQDCSGSRVSRVLAKGLSKARSEKDGDIPFGERSKKVPAGCAAEKE